MKYEDMTMEERVDWSAAYVLKALIAGEFRSGVWMAIDMALRHPVSPTKKPSKGARGK